MLLGRFTAGQHLDVVLRLRCFDSLLLAMGHRRCALKTIDALHNKTLLETGGAILVLARTDAALRGHHRDAVLLGQSARPLAVLGVSEQRAGVVALCQRLVAPRVAAERRAPPASLFTCRLRMLDWWRSLRSGRCRCGSRRRSHLRLLRDPSVVERSRDLLEVLFAYAELEQHADDVGLRALAESRKVVRPLRRGRRILPFWMPRRRNTRSQRNHHHDRSLHPAIVVRSARA